LLRKAVAEGGASKPDVKREIPVGVLERHLNVGRRPSTARALRSGEGKKQGGRSTFLHQDKMQERRPPANAETIIQTGAKKQNRKKGKSGRRLSNQNHSPLAVV
jgi:hypothetical protein